MLRLTLYLSNEVPEELIKIFIPLPFLKIISPKQHKLNNDKNI